jgi:hypothetical protein
MTNDKNKLRALVDSIVAEDYISAKEKLESVVESTIVAHFKSVLENKETK